MKTLALGIEVESIAKDEDPTSVHGSEYPLHGPRLANRRG